VSVRLFPLLLLATLPLGSPTVAAPDPISRYSNHEAQEEVRSLSVQATGSYVQLSAGQTIQSLFLPDSSRVVYSTNVPVQTGEAQIIFFKPVEPLEFQGEIRAKVPNLHIGVRDRRGDVRVYTVQLFLEGGHPSRIIIGEVAAREVPANEQYLQTRFGRANVHDVEAGIQVAISRGSLEPTSATAQKIREFVALWRNGTGVNEERETTGLALGTLTRLAADGQTKRARDRLQQFESTEPEDNKQASPTPPDADVALPSSP